MPLICKEHLQINEKKLYENIVKRYKQLTKGVVQMVYRCGKCMPSLYIGETQFLKK